MFRSCTLGLLMLLCGCVSQAQVVFNINSGNIKQTALSLDQATNVYTPPIISLIPSVNVRSDAAYLTGNTLPVNLFSTRLVGAGGVALSLISATQTVTLSTTAQNAYGQVLSVLQSGALTWRYGFQGWGAYALKAGTYATGVTFGLGGIGQGSLTPLTTTITLNVGAFITQNNSVSSIAFRVNTLNYFRTTGLSSANDVTVTTTVPYGMRVKAANSKFIFSNGNTGVADPQTVTSYVTAQLASKTLNLQNTFQDLTPSGGAVIPVGNQPLNTVNVQISAADLKAAFMAKGLYSTSLSYEVYDAQASAQASTASFTCPITVTVDELAELKVNQTDVSLNYNNATDYAQGVKSDVGGHLTLSSTVPYDVYVKANSATMANGTQTIPVSVIDITPTSTVKQATLSTVTLSTIPQKIITGGMPDIDRPVDVRYAIPASRSQQLLNKTSGTYNATVTYSFVAP